MRKVIELYTKLKEIYSDIKMAIMSGRIEDIEKRDGVLFYLPKPFNVDELLGLIGKYIGNSQKSH